MARFFVVQLVVELTIKSFEKVQNLHRKRQKLQFFDISGHFEALFFYKMNLSRNESSPKQQVCEVHEVNRYFDKK